MPRQHEMAHPATEAGASAWAIVSPGSTLVEEEAPAGSDDAAAWDGSSATEAGDLACAIVSPGSTLVEEEASTGSDDAAA